MKYSEIQYNGCKSHFPNPQRRRATRENWQHGSMGFSHVTCVSADVWRKEDLLVTMLKLLDKISPTECPKLLHRVVDGLCGRSHPKHIEYADTWSLLEWGELVSSLNYFFRVAVGRKCSDQEVQELLGDLESVHAKAVQQCVHARQEEIRQALVDRTNRICSTHLDDFNWQLKLALSSDKLSPLNTPLLNLCLDLTENGIQRAVNIEMSKEELNTLITSLEAANKVVMQMK